MGVNIKIIYVTNLCTPKTYNSLFQDAKTKSSEAVQKFHRLFVEGFSTRKKNKVVAISTLPVSPKVHKRVFWKINSERLNGVTYSYSLVINLPVLKHIFDLGISFLRVLKASLFENNCLIICDSLNYSIALGSVMASKVTKTKSLAIVTDLPLFFDGCSERQNSRFQSLCHKFDYYVFLTKDMNHVLNFDNKPYLVIEGLVDYKMLEKETTDLDSDTKIICMYAGSMQKKYGIDMLVEGFLKANINNCELHLYGNGDYVKELKIICKRNKNIKYFASKSNEYIVNRELKATLLINPRPTHEEYTKYSFPSKNMEYMVSGTPVLTTKLPGMPKEYLEYVYLIEEETAEGVAKALIKTLIEGNEKLKGKGLKAKQFVLKHKNNIIQTNKIERLVMGRKVN